MPRKEQQLLSPVNCWYLVLTQTRRESRDHATLNDILLNNVSVRLAQVADDVIRLFKKVGRGRGAAPGRAQPSRWAWHCCAPGQRWDAGEGAGCPLGFPHHPGREERALSSGHRVAQQGRLSCSL